MPVKTPPVGVVPPRTYSAAELKARRTDEAARAISEAEAAARERKTQKLRAARLAREAEGEAAGKEKPRKTKRKV
jgi:hypothetical protein